MLNSKVHFISETQTISLSEKRGSKRFALHDEAMRVAENYRRCEIELFDLISEIDEKQIYFDLEIPTLHQYCVEMLKLSAQVTYDFMSVIRKAREVPALRTALQSKRTTLSKLRKICSVVTEKNAAEWIGLTCECPSRVVEKAVAMANPRTAIAERMNYVSAETLQFQLAVSETWATQLQKLKDILSQKEKRAVSSEEALFIATSDFLRKHDPVLRAQRATLKRQIRKNESDSRADPGMQPKSPRSQKLELHRQRSQQREPNPQELSQDSESKIRREEPTLPPQKHRPKPARKIPASVLHKIHLRDQSQCTYVDSQGKRCKETRWLQKHHIKHFAEGGDHTVENLQTLCWGHHCMQHRQQR